MLGDDIQDFVQLAILNDATTPYEFVISLLEDVFGRTPHEAKIIATTAHHFGEADCGVWPRPVAEALLTTAQEKVRAAGHSLAFARSGAEGRRVAGQDACAICGKPESQAVVMYRKVDGGICDACVVEAAAKLSAKVTDAQFRFAHEILAWHFEGIGLSELESSVRSFPMRMRADLQLALDQVLKPRTIRQLGIKPGYRYQPVEFADLWERERQAQAIVPVQYTELALARSSHVDASGPLSGS